MDYLGLAGGNCSVHVFHGIAFAAAWKQGLADHPRYHNLGGGYLAYLHSINSVLRPAARFSAWIALLVGLKDGLVRPHVCTPRLRRKRQPAWATSTRNGNDKQ
jgi:hypothetical protein